MIMLIFCALLLSGCGLFQGSPETDAAPGSLRVGAWNLEAMFDGEESGQEYAEYLAGAGWSGEKYRARITAASRALGEISGGAPDILALVEVENQRVLEDLARELKGGHQYLFFAGNPGFSLGLGIISRYPLTGTRAHSVLSVDGVTPRPVLEARVNLRGKDVIVLLCHWKSKLGDEEATELLRRASARAVLRRLREIAAENPATPVVILGDLNENHDEFYRSGGEMICALMPDDPGAAQAAVSGGNSAVQEDFLVLSDRKPPEPRWFPPDSTVLYTPWGRELDRGSYAYHNAWETIDHILLSAPFFDRRGWDFADCEVLRREPFARASGWPNDYNPATGSGLSDHLPLLLSLVFME